jgi:ATP-dependent Clp endopeptidase proteolytic subunit ClpP
MTEMSPALEAAHIRKLESDVALNEARLYEVNLNNSFAERQAAELAASPDSRRIYTFNGTVSGMNVEHAIRTLGQWSRRDPGSPIELVIDTPGGNVFDGLALFDFIQSLRENGHHVITSTVGMAASMGGVLLQAGDERVAGRNSFMLIHEVSSGAQGKVADIEDQVAFTKVLQAKLVTLLAERSTMTVQQIKRKWVKTDWWLDAEQMLALGFIDRIR